MTDPSNALRSFQEELWRGTIEVQPGALNPNIFFHFDHLTGRFSYVTLENNTVTAFVTFAPWQRIEGMHCFNIGYAVPEAYRKQGRAKEVLRMAIAELQHGLGRGRISTFYVEAIIGADNKPSQRVAEQLLSAAPVEMTDEVSGLPALQYIRKIEGPVS